MNLRNIIKQITHQSDSKIWKKYIHYIFPTVLVMIIVMNFTVYRAVSDDIQAKTREMALQTVTIQSENLSNLLYRYIGDLNILKSYFTPDDMTDFIKKANETLYKHTKSRSLASPSLTAPRGQTTRIWIPSTPKSENISAKFSLRKKTSVSGFRTIPTS